MQRWFLSYNSRDFTLVDGLQNALKRKDPDAQIFFAPKSLRAGGYWLPSLAEEIAEATAFALIIGENGLGPWQVMEYYEALDRRVKSPDFPVVLVLLEGQPAPGLAFLRQLHWIMTQDPGSDQTAARLVDAGAGGGSRPGELWRYTSPYRGLAAMTEADSDFFFGRQQETGEVLAALANTTDRLPVLLGNSGVGKSSLAQAGVLAALKRQAWPDDLSSGAAWPQAFHDSRRWCFLTFKPGADPLKALVEPFSTPGSSPPPIPSASRAKMDGSKFCAKRRPRCMICLMPPRGGIRSSIRPSHRPSSSMSIKAKSSTCAPRKVSACAFQPCWPRVSATRGCAP